MTELNRSSKRSVLLLQGLMGPFFRRIGYELIRNGYEVHKVNFNGGDSLYWRLPGSISYRGTPEDWPAFLERIVAEHAITDVLLFGDCRPLHRAAIAVCERLHVPVHVFEEGYIRPDWVTLELGGVNGHSTLPRDPAFFRAEAALLEAAPEHRPVPASFRTRAFQGLCYNTADLLMRWRYPHWDNYRPWHPLTEGMGWLRKLGRRREREARTEATLKHLLAAGKPFVVFPLQLDADAQVRLHSRFSGMAEAIRHVVRSFAEHAPPDLCLVVKEHPLDNGVRDWGGELRMQAAAHGVADRVSYLETGNVAVVLEKSAGVVTINSTTGTLAIAAGVPVITLGDAVYDIPGITFQDGLDAFWSAPGLPDAATFEAFRRVLIDRCLVAGGFFSEAAMSKLVDGAMGRLKAHSPVDFARASRAAQERRRADRAARIRLTGPRVAE